MGSNKHEDAFLLGLIGIALSVIVMTFTAILMFTIPELIIAIYTQDPDVKEIAVKLLLLAGIFQISDGLQVSALGALRGLKDTKIPMIFNIISYWIFGLPMVYLFGIHLKIGPEGLWIGLIIGLSVAAVFHNCRFYLLMQELRHSKSGPESVSPDIVEMP
jgi:MATE family multidrug resistance protein